MTSSTEEKRKEEEARKNIIRYILIGVTLTLLIFTVGTYILPPGRESEFPSYLEKFVYTLQWQAFSVLTLLFGVHKVGTMRWSTGKAMDPVHGKGEHLLAFEQKYLQNTLEELVLSVSGQLILSTYLTAPYLTRVIPVLVSLFVVGRVLFYIGYKIDPLKRAVGFSMAYFPNVLMLLYCSVCFFFYKRHV